MALQGPSLQSKPASLQARPVVLLVDDEPDVVESLADLVREEFQLDAVTALSGFEALRILETRHVDAVVSDFRMPVMDGCEFLQEVQVRFPRIPCLMLSAHWRPVMEQEACKDLKVRAFLRKPVDLERLGAELQTILDPAPTFGR